MKVDHMQLGKVPPQALDLEIAVLGAIMLEKEAYYLTEAILSPKVFYKDAHQLIYSAIQSLSIRNSPIDILTVKQEISDIGKLNDIGGDYYISQLTSQVSSSANIETHAHIIYEKFMQRELSRISTEANKESYDDCADVFNSIEKFANQITALADVSSIDDEMRSISDGLIDTIRLIEGTDNTSGITGIPTGYAELDKITGGWQKNNLILLAGRPGMGKTTLALNFALNAAEHNHPGAIFSMEMSESQLIMKMQANKSELDFDKIRRNQLSSSNWETLNVACDKLSRCKIKIDDISTLAVRTLKSKARKLKRKGQLEWMIVDYLQLMDGSECRPQNREQEISYISRSLKHLAKELRIPIIALASLSRESEKRGGKREPMLSDLRGSGDLESDSDIVVFIHRPEYYDIMEDEAGFSTAGLAQIIFAKNRDGAVGRCKLRYIPHISKFTDYDSIYFTKPVADLSEGEVVVGANLTKSFYEADKDEDFDPPF